TSLIEGTSLFGTTGGGLGTSASSSSSRRTTGSSSNRYTPSTSNRAGVPVPTNPNVSQSPEQQEKPVVVADEASNSLIIASSPSQFEDLEKIIKEIDLRKSQVLIELALVELSLDDSYK